MNISQSQSDALGGCQECRAASTPATESERNPVASVLVVDPKKPDWIGIELTGRDGAPIPGEPFTLTVGDGAPVTGSLDARGRIRIEGVDPGSYKVTFPQLDAKEWKHK